MITIRGVASFINKVWAGMADFFTMPSTSIDLGFLRDNVQNQINHSRAIVAQADRLNAVLDKINDLEARKVVSEVVLSLLETANGMADNVISTATSASSSAGATYVTPLVVKQKP